MALAFVLRGGRESFAFAAVFLTLSPAAFLPPIRATLSARARTALPFALALGWCALGLLAGPPLDRHLYRLAQLVAYLLLMLSVPSWTERRRRAALYFIVAAAVFDATLFLCRRFADADAVGYLRGNPSYSGLLWAAAFIAAIVLAADSPARFRLPAALCGLLFGSALLLLRSRSALVGLLAGLFFVLPRRRYLILLAVAAAAAGGLFLIDAGRFLAYVKIDPAHPAEWLGRLQIWQTALRSIPDHPVLGCGLGNFEAEYLRHQLPVNDVLRFDRTSPFAHNDYLQLAVEGGLPALGFFLWGLVAWFRRRSDRAPDERWAVAVVTVFAVAALFNFTVLLPFCGLIGALALGMGFDAGRPRRDARPAVGAALAALILVPLGVFLVFDASADRLVADGRADAAARLVPFRGDLWYASAMERMNRPDWLSHREVQAEVIDRLQRAAHANPGDAFVWNRLGVVSMSLINPPADAGRAFEVALTLAPSHAPFWIDAGFERLEANDLAGARERFQTAATLEPNAAMPRFALALAAAHAGDRAEARADLAQAIDLRRRFGAQVPPSGYADYLFGLDEQQMTSRVARAVDRSGPRH